jgi:hypothetical protein
MQLHMLLMAATEAAMLQQVQGLAPHLHHAPREWVP